MLYAYNVMLHYIHVDCLGRELLQNVMCDVMELVKKLIILFCVIMSLIFLHYFSHI